MTLTIEANAASPVPGEGAEVKVMHSAHAQTCVASAASVLVDWCRFVLLAGGPTPPVPPGSPGPHNPNPQPNPIPGPTNPGSPPQPSPVPDPVIRPPGQNRVLETRTVPGKNKKKEARTA